MPDYYDASGIHSLPQKGAQSFGYVPTPQGPIVVEWERHEARFSLTLEAPETVALQVVLPVKARRVEINDQLVWEAGQSGSVDHSWSVEHDEDNVRLSCSVGGEYQILAQ